MNDAASILEFEAAFKQAFGAGHARRFRIARVGTVFRIEQIIKAPWIDGHGKQHAEPAHRDYTQQALQAYIKRLKTYEHRKRDTRPLGW